MKLYKLMAIAACAWMFCYSNNALAFGGSAAPAPAPAAQGQEEAQTVPLGGRVIEALDAGGYSYICIEKDGVKTWVALPWTDKVKKGEVVFFQPGYTMYNFNSKTLNRTFDQIVFSMGLMTLGKDEPANMPKHDNKITEKPAKPVKVEKAAGADAYTIAEIYEKAGALKDKNVMVKGKVVKFSAGIMGKNWIHLQDGTGSADNGNNDLLVTTDGEAAPGDTITAKGKLLKDKDFGAGYSYAVMIENAEIIK